jgi:transcription initiation factor TFIID subunit 12
MDPSKNPVNQPLLQRSQLQDLAKMISPGEKIEPNVEGILIKIAEDFVSKVAHSSADLAKHRKSKMLEAEDVQLHLGIK